jgi:hypothetical protein
MPEILPIRLRPPVVRLFGDRESRNLNRLILIFPVSRAGARPCAVPQAARAEREGRWSLAADWLQIGCSKNENPEDLHRESREVAAGSL